MSLYAASETKQKEASNHSTAQIFGISTGLVQLGALRSGRREKKKNPATGQTSSKCLFTLSKFFESLKYTLLHAVWWIIR